MKHLKEASRKAHEAKVKAYGGTCKAHGGHVHDDVKADKALVHSMVKPSALKRAHGGKVKGKTQVNVIVPHGGAGGLGPMAAAPRPPMAPPAGLPGGVPPMGGAAAPMRPPVMAARGGRIKYDAGAGTGEGRLEKVKNYGHKHH